MDRTIQFVAGRAVLDGSLEASLTPSGPTVGGSCCLHCTSTMASDHDDLPCPSWHIVPQDFHHISSIEWGPAKADDDYDSDQELAPRPKAKLPDRCHCRPPLTCSDESCVNYSCNEECPRGCIPGCTNNRLTNRISKAMDVFDAGPKGIGLKVLEPVRKAEIITEYIGRAIAAKDLNKTFRRYQYDRRLYILSLGNGIFLDAREKGSLARFMNHSCDPNCLVQLWKVKGRLRAAVVALRDIPAGEEMTFDYQWAPHPSRAPTKCHCNSVNCRGTLETKTHVVLEEEFWKTPTTPPDQSLINKWIRVNTGTHMATGAVTGYDTDEKKHRVYLEELGNERLMDLTQCEWQVWDCPDRQYIIAKKVQNAEVPVESSLLKEEVKPSAPAKHYIYVQTPIRDALMAKHSVELCQRNCQVQIQVQRCRRPAGSGDPNDTELADMLKALDQSQDGVVWKMTISGSQVAKAHDYLTKNIVQVTERLERSEERPSISPTPASDGASTLNVVFSRQVADIVKRKLPLWRDACRNVTLGVVPSASKSKLFAKLEIGGSRADIASARDYVWKELVHICMQGKLPTVHENLPRDLAVYVGSLDSEDYKLLCGDVAADEAQEMLRQSPFFSAFQQLRRCAVWVQPEDDKGRIDSLNRVVDVDDGTRQIHIGACDIREVESLWIQLKLRLSELRRGIRYMYLGNDAHFLPRDDLASNESPRQRFSAFLEQFCGVSITSSSTKRVNDAQTDETLRLDAGVTDASASLPPQVQALSPAERIGLAEELVRLQIEINRSHAIKQGHRLFGRDWNDIGKAVALREESEQKSSVPGQLDSRSVRQGAIEITEIMSQLNHEPFVAAHAVTILYRYYASSKNLDVKAREAVLACVFLANKAQQANRWKGLHDVLRAGFKIYYPKSEFNREEPNVKAMVDRVLRVELEILKSLNYDIFTENYVAVSTLLRSSKKFKDDLIEDAFRFAYAGDVLSLGPELWLAYGIRYVVAIGALFLKGKASSVVSALSLDPGTLIAAAELLIGAYHAGTAIERSKKSRHSLLEGGRDATSRRLDRLRDSLNDVVLEQTQPRPLVVSATAQSVPRRNLMKSPDLTRVVLSSECTLQSISGEIPETEDIAIAGSVRAVATACSLLRGTNCDDLMFPPLVVSSISSPPDYQPGTKVDSGLVPADHFKVSDGWIGNLVNVTMSLEAGKRFVGSKGCLAATVSSDCMHTSELRWMAMSMAPLATTRCLPDCLTFKSAVDKLAALSKLAGSTNQTTEVLYPTLSRLGAGSPEFATNPAVGMSLQRWPPEKVEASETKRQAKEKHGSDSGGFSAAALQEMQLICELHGSAGTATNYHRNFMLPVGIAIFDDTKKGEGLASSRNSDIMDTSGDDAIFSLFRSHEENEDAAEREKSVKGTPHLVLEATPFALQSFLSRKWRDAPESKIGPLLLRSWMCDLISAVAHCHANHVIIRTFQLDFIFVDQSGTLKIGGLYRGTYQSRDDRSKKSNPKELLKQALKSKKKDDDVSSPYVAPEVLLGCPSYSKESDMWSLGCILAHLLLGKPLFQGRDRESLLSSQFKYVGVPAKENFEIGKKFPMYTKPVKTYVPAVKKAIEKMVKSDNAEVARVSKLISRMLQLDPSKRCRAKDAMKDDFVLEYFELMQTQQAQDQYAAEWSDARRAAYGIVGDSAGLSRAKNLKRKAMLAAASVEADVGDNLYDMDDLLDEPVTSKSRTS